MSNSKNKLTLGVTTLILIAAFFFAVSSYGWIPEYAWKLSAQQSCTRPERCMDCCSTQNSEECYQSDCNLADEGAPCNPQ